MARFEAYQMGEAENLADALDVAEYLVLEILKTMGGQRSDDFSIQLAGLATRQPAYQAAFEILGKPRAGDGG
jgi:hypothetical protein